MNKDKVNKIGIKMMKIGLIMTIAVPFFFLSIFLATLFISIFFAL